MNQKYYYPLVSICVPVYGVEKWIERCARSLFEQTYQNLEYIFVDDCSKDNSIEILNSVLCEYPNRIPQIKIIRNEKNRGISATRTIAMEAVTGEFLIHIDSDDWINKSFVENCVIQQQKNNADLVFGNIQVVGTLIGSDNPFICRKITNDKTHFLSETLSFKTIHTVWGILIRSSLQCGRKIYPIEGINVGDDYQVLPKLIYFANSLDNANDAIYYYSRFNDTSYTHITSERNIRQDIATLSVVADFFNDKETIYKNAINFMRANYVFQYMDSFAQINNSKLIDYVMKDYNKIDAQYKTSKSNFFILVLKWNQPWILRLFSNLRDFKRRMTHKFRPHL